MPDTATPPSIWFLHSLENPANKKCMEENENASAPVFTRSTRLLRFLRAQVEAHIGRQLTYEDLSKLTGQSRSTLGNWFNGDGEPSMDIVLTLWEQLPNPDRSKITENPIFRCRPTLDHRRIAHNPIAVSQLKQLLTQRKGLTIVQSEREELVTFVVTAMGHTLTTMLKPPYTLSGFDTHCPDWFVPVTGVNYLMGVAKQRAAVAALDGNPQLRRQWLIFNGIPGLEQAARLARENHVIFGDQAGSPPRPLPSKITAPVHIITASPMRSYRKSIQLHIHAVASNWRE